MVKIRMDDHPSVNLCFFWHMHQPDYRGSDGVMSMPWVFLHAIKDYYEMPWLLSRYEGVKATFNITAPLIEQLNLYNEPLKNDYFLSLWHQQPSTLNEEEKNWLIKTCKSTQYETMIKPIAVLDTLYHKESLTDNELIDFEMLFMLAWCGNYLRQENDVVKTLFKKGQGFTQGDKADLLNALTVFITTILPFYAKLQKEEVISLSTTPYNHPILPLLLDMNNAKYANEHTTIVSDPISLREDAIEQVERAIALYEETFGFTPTGFWPAEGAVDEESVAIYKEHGIKWIATDEAILFRSLKSDKRENLYKPYVFNGVTIGFRDHGLSDLIGFNYRFKSGYDASEHFMHVIEPIAHKQKNATVFVILDGENAWEFFENNAYEFFTALYSHFIQTSWCKTVTMDEISKIDEAGILKHLSPGSWIHGNFDTWAGHSEKNRAWELIYQTKRDVENYQGEIDDDVMEKIKFHFLASECSDWFWWYGDDHITEFGLEFDSLFREHLMSIYYLLNMQPPSDLFEPIITQKNAASFLQKPHREIRPYINGKNCAFFDWLGAGLIDESKLYSTMDRVRGPVEKIYYGHDDTTVFLAFEGYITSLKKENILLQVTVEETGDTINLPLKESSRTKKAHVAVGERLEVALMKPFFKDTRSFHLRFEIVEGNNIIQTMPGYGAIFINLDENYAQNWFV